MMDIKDIQGNILFSISAKEDCIHREELMRADYVQLSWNTNDNTELPLGAYVDWNGKRYSLLAPYRPSQVNEAEWKYEPQFQSKVMGWSVKPFFFIDYNTDGSIKSKETDWTLTDTAANFMSAIVKSIKEETGETWTVVVDASLAGTKSQSFQSTDIFSALNSIASLWETEWWADEENKELHLSKCSYGTQQVLEVGANIQTPTVTENKEGYYTRFYAFGSTRNITQDYVTGGSTSHIVQKRLTLPKSTCPNGYKDIRPNLKEGEVNVKVLIFDDIYPKSNLTISNVRSEQRYVVDGEGNKIQIGEKDGQPVYDMYSVFFFTINGFEFDPASVSNGGMVIDGKNLSVHFKSGTLIDREFELSYHKDITEYEILYDNSTGYIIPNEILLPSDGDKVILFNIKMPDEYITSSEIELESALDKEMAERQKDLNTYNFKSNAVDFYEKSTTLHIGQKVLYKNGSYQLETRVLTLEEKLDYPCEKTISIGEQKIKGTTQELKEEVTNINKDVNVIAELNNLSISIQNAYGRTQQQIAAAMSQWANMWYFDKSLDTTPNKTDPSKWIVRGNFDVAVQGGLTMYTNNTGIPVSTIMDGVSVDGVTITKENGRLKVIGGAGGQGTVKGIILNATTYDPAENGYITLPDTYSKEEVDNKIGIYSAKVDNFLEGSDTDGIINKWKELEAFLAGQSQTSTLAELLSVKADKATTLAGYGITDAYTKEELNTKFLDYVTLTTAQTVAGVKDFTNGIKIGSIPVTKHSDGILEIDGDLLVTGNITMFAQGSRTASTIMDGVAVDGTTIIKENGRLKVIGGGAEGTVKGIILNEKTYDPAENGYVTLPDLVTTVKWGDIENPPTTIAGYGITDAYTKDQISTELGKYVTLATAQEVSGVKDFTAGIKIGSIPVVKHSSGILEIDGDLIVTGGITMFAQGSRTASTILDGLEIDTATLSKTGGKLSVIGGGGGGLASVTVKLGTTAYDSVGGVVSLPAYPTTLPASDVPAWAKAASKPTYAWSEIVSKPSWIGTSKPSYSWNEISSKPSWIGSSKPSYSWSEISSKPSWIGSSKPSYSFSEIASKPTTIGGYGITDAYKIVPISTSGADISASGTIMEGGFWSGVGSYASFVQSSYGGQLRFMGDFIAYRSVISGSPSIWHTILHVDNYNSYAPTLTGAGASGTWGISISGTAAVASKLGTSTIGSSAMPIYLSGGVPTVCSSVLGVSVTGYANFLGNYTAASAGRVVYHAGNDFVTGLGAGASSWYMPSNSVDASFKNGMCLRLAWSGDVNYFTDIFTSPSTHYSTGLFYRQVVNGNVSPDGWRILLDSVNYSNVLNSSYVTLDTTQTVSGVKDFTAGIKIGSIPVIKHSSGILEIDGDLIVTGAITMFAQGSQTASTILDALPVDTSTLSKAGGKLSVIGSGGSSLAGIKVGSNTYYPDSNRYITIGNYYDSEVSRTANTVLAAPNGSAGSAVFRRLVSADIPDLSWSKITSGKPTTLSGYGISDGFNTISTSGSGNAVVGASYSGHTLTLRMGTISGGSSIAGIKVGTATYTPDSSNYITLGNYYDAEVSRTANTVLAAPNGSAGGATFRRLVAADIPDLAWSKITSGKPTSLSGYGITDGFNYVTTSGSGSVVVGASYSGHTLTLKMGSVSGGSSYLESYISASSGLVTLKPTMSSSYNIALGNSVSPSSSVPVVLRANSSNPLLGFYLSGSNWYVQCTGSYMYVGATSAKSFRIDSNGNGYLPGSITASNISDARLKTGFDCSVDYCQKIMALGRVVDYRYNDLALKVKSGLVDRERHTGLIYQNALKAGIPGFCLNSDKDGYGSLNWLSPDLMATIVGAVQINIAGIAKIQQWISVHDREIQKLKKENMELKNRIKNLERRVV